MVGTSSVELFTDAARISDKEGMTGAMWGASMSAAVVMLRNTWQGGIALAPADRRFERADGRYVYSLRSRGDFDVGELAQTMGGGGHRQAAGFTTSTLVNDRAKADAAAIQAGLVDVGDITRALLATTEAS